MTKYPPGSFTKNFGWSQSPPGLSRLYDVIRDGFSGSTVSVTRDFFRAHCGVSDTNRQLIPINFFLHNSIKQGMNFISADELVRHALNNGHSRRFDRLALFAFHLARLGRRLGVSGNSYGAAFANEFVRNQLWDSGGWQRSRLTDEQVEKAFKATLEVAGADTAHKCMTNYMYMLELSGLRYQQTATINTHPDEWAGPGLFLAFDRFWLDVATPPTQAALVEMVATSELHKLMGVTTDYLMPLACIVSEQYLDLGGIDRISNPASTTTSGTPISSPVVAPVGTGEGATPTWSDEAAEDVASVMRRAQEVQAQVRNLRHAKELKALYDHRCMFCGERTIIGVDPTRYYSEGAHIKPVGDPHKGPDRKDNMLVLCPIHHLQFDRGILRVRNAASGPVIVSKVVGDPLHGTPVRIQSPHVIDDTNTAWHLNFWK